MTPAPLVVDWSNSETVQGLLRHWFSPRRTKTKNLKKAEDRSGLPLRAHESRTKVLNPDSKVSWCERKLTANTSQSLLLAKANTRRCFVISRTGKEERNTGPGQLPELVVVNRSVAFGGVADAFQNGIDVAGMSRGSHGDWRGGRPARINGHGLIGCSRPKQKVEEAQEHRQRVGQIGEHQKRT